MMGFLDLRIRSIISDDTSEERREPSGDEPSVL